MSDEKKPRTLELRIEIDAPVESVWKAITEGAHIAGWFAPEASVSGPGEGGLVTVSWGEEMAFTTKVAVWKPNEHLRWLDESGFMGPGTALQLDFYLTTEKGRTHLRVVQSGLGESPAWDEFFEGTESGWSYFLYNLGVYVETHLGRARQMIAKRLPVTLRRELAWERILAAATGLVVAGSALEAGSRVSLDLGGAAPVAGVVSLVRPRRAIAFRVAELGDALLFVELESGQESFHLGLWLSVYDQATAARVRQPVLARFERLGSTLKAD